MQVLSSYFCERTAEYVLIPRMSSILSEFSSAIRPIYFWQTREGNRTSQELNAISKVRIVALYVRRPKKTTMEHCLAGKIQREVFAGAKLASRCGILPLAGFPVVHNVWEMGPNAPILWLDLDDRNEMDVEFVVDATYNKLQYNKSAFLRSISDSEIPTLASNSCMPFTWVDAISAMREVCLTGSTNWFGMGMSKPVFLLCVPL